MARNWDGTIVKKTPGQLATSVTGTASRFVTQPAYIGGTPGGGLVYAGSSGNRRPGWRVVSVTER